MCGIAGILDLHLPGELERRQRRLRLEAMTAALAHRGPDGESLWESPSGFAVLGHRRLRILDLSPAAAQPMHRFGRYSLVCNGEIYNYLELREQLRSRGYSFSTASDTEVLLAAYDCWKQDCLGHLDGMFALAIWDERDRQLFAARDRFGEKPFFYIRQEERFWFASEKKAFWAAGFSPQVSGQALVRYLALGSAEDPLHPESGYHLGVSSLPAAHYLQWDGFSGKTQITSYWDLDKNPHPAPPSEKQAREIFLEKLTLSVRRRLRSDVAVGASLSGGLDSSSLVALACGLQPSGGRLATFSALFPGFEKDESPYVQQMTDTFGLSSYRVTPRAEELARDLERLCFHQEDPFVSSSVYAQLRVYEAARQQGIPVLLDGQGADETLAGYGHHASWYLIEKLRTDPLAIFREKRALDRNGVAYPWKGGHLLAALFPAQAAGRLEKRTVRRLLRLPFGDPAFIHAYGEGQEAYRPMVFQLSDHLYFATCQWGLPELLRYADRNAMAVGRELRLPFLSHELVEFMFSLPSSFKIQGGWTKWLLRSAMSAELPASIAWRADKVGFEPPQASWMQTPVLQELVGSARRQLVARGVMDRSILQAPLQPRGALHSDNLDWRCLVAATTLAGAGLG